MIAVRWIGASYVNDFGFRAVHQWYRVPEPVHEPWFLH